MKVIRVGLPAVLAVVFGILVQTVPARAQNFSDAELKCTKVIGKNFAKMQSTILKLTTACHADDISGEGDSTSACETLSTGIADKVAQAKEKFVESVAKACHNTCTVSDGVQCISDLSCPAAHQAAPAHNNLAETCAGKGSFNLFGMDWPGPYCESVLGHPLRAPSDLGTCLSSLADVTIDAIDEAVYSSLDETSGLTDDNQRCLAAISKALTGAVSKSYSATAKCRDARRDAFSAAHPLDNPAHACASEDEKTVAAIQKNVDKLNDSISKACGDGDIAALTGLCGTGGVTPTTVAEAQACLDDLLREIATQERAEHRHVYSRIGMLNITHPGSAAGYCGDGVVEPTREEHTGVGEECDLGSDSACPGHCLPPGDLFECTCDTVARERFVVDGDADRTDSDAGWKGAAHEATNNDGFGYVTELSNCDCSAFTGADCTGTSSDPICDVFGNMAPRCSDDLHGSQTCDERGDNNGSTNDFDCFKCDSDSLNAGTWCGYPLSTSKTDQTVCQSQCIDDATGMPVVPAVPCQNQAGCAVGSSCRGRCDNSIRCNTMTEGSPLPLISGQVPVCVTLEYRTDVTGTKNMVTGEQEVTYRTASLIGNGILNFRPCPVCGGLCVGGTSAGDTCNGRCDVSGDKCLFDEDCTAPGDTACLETDDDCAGGTCSLDLRCSAGGRAGKLCHVDSVTSLGVMSHNCPSASNDSGLGVEQNFGIITTKAVQFPTPTPCTAPGFQNFDCPCPPRRITDSPAIGIETKPNDCYGACDAGVNMGHGCGVGEGHPGEYTKCVGGTDGGSACDSNADCDGGGTCTDQPSECTTAATPNLQGVACTTNTDCGVGGVCGDPCPGGRCVPLCLPEGRCNGGGRDGDTCATTEQCRQCTAGNPLLIGSACETNARCNSTPASGDGVCSVAPGVTCDVVDPEDGICAAAAWRFFCNGDEFRTIKCTLEYGTCSGGHCTMGSASLRNTSCSQNSDCIEDPNVPVSAGCETGEDAIAGTEDDLIGAGECEPQPLSCFINNGYAIGDDTVIPGGTGSATNVDINAAFCVPPNSNNTVNDIPGYGGPQRIRKQGVSTVNVPSIP